MAVFSICLGLLNVCSICDGLDVLCKICAAELDMVGKVELIDVRISFVDSM